MLPLRKLGLVPVRTLWETVSSHWQVRKLGCLSLKSCPHRLRVTPAFLVCPCRGCAPTWAQITASARETRDAMGMDGNCPWRCPGWCWHCCGEGRLKTVPRGLRSSCLKSDEWEGLYISTCGCFNISAWDCLARSCKCLYVSTCENLNIWIWEPVSVSTWECLNVEYLGMSVCECLNISTCERLNVLTCGWQPVNVSTVLMYPCLNTSPCKCHNRSVCDVDMWTCVCLNMQMSCHLNVWLSTCECHSTSAPKSWVSHCLPSKPSPSERWWILAHGNLNPYGSSLLVQTSTRFYRWKVTWSSFVTVR